MPQNTLLEKGACSLKVALSLKNDPDDGVLCIAAYHAQQAGELFVKHHLEISGIAYPKTHDLNVLISLFAQSGVAEPFGVQQLRTISDKLNSYESQTRYVKNYLLARNDVLDALTKLEAIYDGTDMSVIEHATGILRAFKPTVTIEEVASAIRALNIPMDKVPENMPALLMEVTK